MTQEPHETPRRRLPRSFHLLPAGQPVTLLESSVILVVPDDRNRTSPPEHERDWALRVRRGTPLPTEVCSPDPRRHLASWFFATAPAPGRPFGADREAESDRRRDGQRFHEMCRRRARLARGSAGVELGQPTPETFVLSTISVPRRQAAIS